MRIRLYMLGIPCTFILGGDDAVISGGDDGSEMLCLVIMPPVSSASFSMLSPIIWRASCNQMENWFDVIRLIILLTNIEKNIIHVYFYKHLLTKRLYLRVF